MSAQRFILLPALSETARSSDNPKVKEFLISLNAEKGTGNVARLASRSRLRTAPKIGVKVVDSIQEDGAKLVEITEEQQAEFRFSYPGLRMVPEKFYDTAFIRPIKVSASVATRRSSPAMKIKVTDNIGQPMKGIYVLAFTDFAANVGVDGTTNASGEVSLKIETQKIERLYAYADHTYWSYCAKNVTRAASLTIPLQAIDLNQKDSLRHFYPTHKWKKITKKVRVAVIDTGCGPHHDLPIKGGANMLLNEVPTDYSDNGDGHGTHVAGIIGAVGMLSGVAVGVEIFAYKVFPKAGRASNFDIIKALRQARHDKCDLINLSLTCSGTDEAIVSEIKSAYKEGMLCFAANGNDDRQPVCFPAAHSLVLAVSALGTKATLARDTTSYCAIVAPYGKNKDHFIGDFSNVGPETDLTGPGVGVVSTYPNDRFAVMDGTSMACPAATGLAARLLAEEGKILRMPRKQKRVDEMVKFLSAHIKGLGFSATFEGKGILSI